MFQNEEEEGEEQDELIDDDIMADQMMADVDKGNYSDSEDGESIPKKKDPLPMSKAQSTPVPQINNTI